MQINPQNLCNQKSNFHTYRVYNMSFIMPLVIFFLFSVLGVSIWRVLDAGKKETVIAKLALAALFLILAAFQTYASFR
jgi:hypothetical protein